MTRNIEDVYDLTPLQHGMLFQVIAAPGSGVYVEQAYLNLTGRLDHDAFWRSWQDLVDRHPCLRTTFRWEGLSKPVQVVHRRVDLPREERDLRALTAEEQTRLLDDQFEQDRTRGIDLETAPLLRLTLFRLADERYRLVLRISHLVLDGWSVGVLLREFVASYCSRFTGPPARLGEPGLFRDYVAWWRAHRGSPEVEAFWRNHLVDHRPPEPLKLRPVTAPPRAGVTHGRVDLSLAGMADEVRSFARAHQLTVHTLMQGAWMAVLARLQGAAEVVAGAAMAHRPQEVPGAQTAVGPMLTTVPVRAVINQDEPVLEWLRGIQDTIIAVRDHAAAPLTDIRGWAGVRRTADLFETIVSFENVPLPELEFPGTGLELENYFFDGRPQYPFGFVVLPGEDLPLRLIFDQRRFSQADAELMLERVRAFLVSVLARPDQRLGEVDVIGPAERDLLRDWQRREPHEPVPWTLPQVIARHAEARPESPAVTDTVRTLTYRELNERANQVAHRLHASGVRPGDRVLLCVDRTVDSVVGFLGVLAAGAAFVPLDPANPAERLAFIAEDCAATAVVTQEALAGLADFGLPVLRLDADAPDLWQEPVTPPEIETSAQDCAYLIYTSGSTGRPKGVLITHENVLRLTRAAEQHVLSAGPDDTWSTLHSFAFDASVWEMWGALWFGSRLLVVPTRLTADLEAVLDLLTREQVTVAMFTPKVFEQVIDLDPGGLALRHVVLGGDRVDLGALRPWFATHAEDEPRLLNCYGPTETTCYCVFHPITAQDAEHGAGLSLIGRPVPDLSAYLLDPAGEPVPVGAVGEICIAGPGLGLGYWNNPELTAARWQPGPDGPIYRTGDLGRYDQQGRIVFLGRADDQVKVRGYRVELGEVVSALRALPGVTDAAAALRGDQLVGYLVRESEVDGIREVLAQRLPEYMVPAAFVDVDRIPLTANGKLDLRALPDPVRRTDDELDVLRTETEHALADLLAGVLETAVTSRSENLVDLGMHSLRGTTVVARIRERWGVRVPLRTLFEQPTVAELAAYVDGGGQRETAEVDLVAEARLPGELRPPAAVPPHEPERVLLTGATGMLGSALLARLLDETDHTVFCLVRADSPDDALRRLRQSAGWRDGWDERIVPVVGSLAEPLLGLTEQRFGALAKTLDEIYHCGAEVNFLHSYRRLRDSNVGGTTEIIRLACTAHVKPVHYVSSGAVVGQRAADSAVPAPERPLDPEPPALSGGYAQTKWVAERLVAQAGERGLPVRIHRAGRIIGDSRTGEWRPGDATGELLRVCAHLGEVPDLDPIDLTPIDYVAAAIVTLAGRPGCAGRVFHLAHPVPTGPRVLADGFARAGRDVTVVPVEQWFADLEQRADRAEFASAITLFGQWVQGYREGRREPVFDSACTTAELAGKVDCPAVDADLLARYVGYFESIGYLSPSAIAPNACEQRNLRARG